MRLFNSALLRPRDVLVIAVISILAHVAARPIYNAVDFKKDDA